jgi:hypothetical protein
VELVQQPTGWNPILSPLMHDLHLDIQNGVDLCGFLLTQSEAALPFS